MCLIDIMSSRYSSKGTHTMPDGTVMSGSTHSASSRVVKKGKKKKDEIPFDELKEGSFKRMLKMKKSDKPLMKSEVARIVKTENGKTFSFRGRTIKMTPLMKKRASLAKTLMKF